ncbi:MAG: hypothetical protein ACQES9_03710 [Myxococcota bacterium]
MNINKTKYKLAILFGVLLLVACEEPFHGSKIISNIYFGSDFTGDDLVTPSRLSNGPGQGYTYLSPGDPGYISHYELYAGYENSGTVRLFNFHIRPALEVHHPCYQIFKNETNVEPGVEYVDMCHYPFPEIEKNMFVFVKAVPSNIDQAFNPGYNWQQWNDNFITSDATVVDKPSCDGQRQEYSLEGLKEFCNNLHPDYYIGNPYQITFPKNGTLYGFLDGSDPRTAMQIGGISLSIEHKLEKINSLFIVAEPDQSRISQENYDLNLPPGNSGKIVLMSEIDGLFGYIDKNMIEGTWHGLMENPQGNSLKMEYTIYYNLDEDPVYF